MARNPGRNLDSWESSPQQLWPPKAPPQSKKEEEGKEEEESSLAAFGSRFDVSVNSATRSSNFTAVEFGAAPRNDWALLVLAPIFVTVLAEDVPLQTAPP